ncbi:acyltransferase family protein [Rhizobium sp. YTU87027]|uniref:acyltransferase family protein n=1 Tax=Rhizobium sp. YTU87027 TaxID=3417741 RepID=UPI003D681055
MKKRYTFLDELRGVAALSVAVLHAAQIFPFPLLSSADIAVDFFFCLSGFVLANAYDEKLRSGQMTGGELFLKRVIRLYPMIVIGVVLGIIASLVSSAPYSLAIHDMPLLTFGGLLLLPTGLIRNLEAFALNNPLWSLSFELAANTIYGFVPGGRKLFRDAAFLGLLAVALCTVIYTRGSISGAGFSSWSGFFAGFPRVGFSFFAGVLIYRWNLFSRLKAVGPKLPLILLAMVFFAPLPPDWELRGWYDLVSITVVIPAVVTLAAAVPEGEARAIGIQLGRLSYPFYAIHQPLIRLAAEFQRATNGMIPLPLIVMLTLFGALGLSHLLLERFDKPVRARLHRALVRLTTKEPSYL